MSDQIIRLPKHDCGLTISHNEFKNYYESLTDYIEHSEDIMRFASPEARQRSIATNELWAIRWYPDTRVGFCLVCAPTLAEALELANSREANASRFPAAMPNPSSDTLP